MARPANRVGHVQKRAARTVTTLLSLRLACRAASDSRGSTISTKSLSAAVSMKALRGEARLTYSNIQDALREVRLALLEADVALPVVKQFIAAVREKATRRCWRTDSRELRKSVGPRSLAPGTRRRHLPALRV